MNALHTEPSIVIADDDSVTCLVLRMLLNEHGCKVVGEAHNGEKAIELCVNHRPDIVFLDINMPRLDGHHAAERIRRASEGVAVIMITTQPTLDNVQKAIQAGAGGFIVKPFNAVKVMETIDNCMKLKRQG